MRIAIATSDEEKFWYKDIEILIKALAEKDHFAESVVWDAPNIEWGDYDAVLIDSTWNYKEKPQAFLSWCKETSTKSILINSFDVINLSSDKEYLITLREAGLNIPTTRIVSNTRSIDDSLLKIFSRKVVIKPYIGSDGKDTYLFDDVMEATRSTELSRMLLNGRVLFQDYIPDIETLGELGAIFIADHLSHCVHKKPARNDFRVQHKYGGISSLTAPPKYVEELYQYVISALKVNPMYMRLDFIPTKNPTIMEVEMVEPEKYFSLYPKGAELLADALIRP